MTEPENIENLSTDIDITLLLEGLLFVAGDPVVVREDGTPLYVFTSVVDDVDFGVSHVIRGDDHLTNTFRQAQLYLASGWDLPIFGHLPLLHGADGAKLSKRHGAQNVEEYRDMGFLPAALRNYLLRLGWGHGDDEIISTAQAIEWFDLPGVGRSASRFDRASFSETRGYAPNANRFSLPLALNFQRHSFEPLGNISR